MSQKNRFNIHVIKTKRIECAKLDMPAMLAQPRGTPTKNDGCAAPRPKASSFQTSSHNPSEFNLRRQTDSRSSLTDSPSSQTDDVLSTPEADEDVVFEESLETPSEAFAKPIKCGARCLSLPACLGSESECDDAERNVCLRPRRLFEEALNLERTRSAAPRGTTPLGEGGGASNEFTRGQETAGRRGGAEDNEVKRCRTWRAAIVREREELELIADYNNNNCSLLEQERVPNYTSGHRSYSSSELRRDWEQKILGLTESGREFGTERERSGHEDEGRRTRPRSVTIAGSVHAFVEGREKARAREAKLRARSDGKHQGMPKFQAVVWDYIKRRSSKRKGKRDGGTKEDSSKPKHSSNEDSTSCFPPVGHLKKDPTSVEHGNSVSRRSTVLEISQSPSLNSDKASQSPSFGKWKSTPNLAVREATEYAERIVQRKNSWDELGSRKGRAKTPVKELKEDPEILRILLTTNSELRPMEERLKTLALSREWLIKELNVMREEDRRLARQFIHLRSAIMEIRQAREKEDSDCESDGEERKSKRIDSKKLAAEQERHINDHGYHMHVTPTRNILSYC